MITVNQFKAWQGSDNITTGLLIQLIIEIANGEYPLEQFRKDVAEYRE